MRFTMNPMRFTIVLDHVQVQENELKPKPKPEIKLKIKPKAKGSEVVNRKRKVSDLDSDSPSVDPDVVRMVISQLSKIKSEEFDDESVKKGKKNR